MSQETPYVNYPRTPGQGKFELNAINDAWRIYITNAAPYIITGGLGLLLAMVAGGAVRLIMLPGFAMADLMGPDSMLFKPAVGMMAIIAQVASSVLSMAVIMPFFASIVRMAFIDMEGERKAQVEDLSYGLKNGLIQFVILGAIFGAISGIAGIFSCFSSVITLVANAFLIVALPLMVHRKMSIGDALQTSFNLTAKSFGHVLLYALVAGLISVLGIFACIVGIFATAGFWGVAQAVAYQRLTQPSVTVVEFDEEPVIPDAPGQAAEPTVEDPPLNE